MEDTGKDKSAYTKFDLSKKITIAAFLLCCLLSVASAVPIGTLHIQPINSLNSNSLCDAYIDTSQLSTGFYLNYSDQLILNISGSCISTFHMTTAT
ncbi:MAG: hypothetical protein ACRDF4_06200, partial [Rhabdochlamydiaceae bacterium]